MEDADKSRNLAFASAMVDLERLNRFRDPYNDDLIEWCGDCGYPKSVVRPGKTQCDYCEALAIIDRDKGRRNL